MFAVGVLQGGAWTGPRSCAPCVCRALEESQQLEVEKALVLTNQGSVMSRQEKAEKFTRGQVTAADLSQNVAAVCSVLLPRVLPRQEPQVLSCSADSRELLSSCSGDPFPVLAG